MVGSAMKIKNINDININFFAKNRYKLFDSAWRGILPNSWLDKITVESTLKNIEKYGYKNDYYNYVRAVIEHPDFVAMNV